MFERQPKVSLINTPPVPFDDFKRRRTFYDLWWPQYGFGQVVARAGTKVTLRWPTHFNADEDGYVTYDRAHATRYLKPTTRGKR